MVVDEHGERDPLLGHERGGVAAIPGADGDDLAPAVPDAGVAVAQLRDMLPAEQSAEVAEEHERDRPVGPVVPEPVAGTLGVFELDVRERLPVHGD